MATNLDPTRLVKLIALGWALMLPGCDSAAEPEDDSDRAPIGKADALAGSCGTEEANACGGPSDDGACWCDDLCDSFGDCCADKATVCDDELLTCGELDLGEPAGEAQCEARPDCTPFLVADCPVCTGGTLVCIEIEPAACEELDLSDGAQRDQCESRPDCALFFEPACPICDGGSEVCVSVQ